MWAMSETRMPRSVIENLGPGLDHTAFTGQDGNAEATNVYLPACQAYHQVSEVGVQGAFQRSQNYCPWAGCPLCK